MRRVALAFPDRQRAGRRATARRVRHVGEAQDPPRKARGRRAPRLAGDEGLARGRGLAGIGRDRRVGAASRIAPSGRPSASAAIWAKTVFDPWPMSTAPWCSTTAAVARRCRADGRRVGQRGVAAAIPAGGDAHAAPAARRPALKARASASARRQCGRSASGTRRCPTPLLQPLAGHCCVAVAKRIADAEFEPVDAERLASSS